VRRWRASRPGHTVARSSNLLLTLAFLAATACQPPERELVRLTELMVTSQRAAAPESVGTALTVAQDPYHLPVELSGARTGRLTLVARGDARSLELAWKLASERRFTRFRQLTVPLVADGETHRYEVDLSREPYWVGAIDRLRLTVAEGSLEVTELTARAGGRTARTAALGGLSLPSLPGLARLELELPPAAPRRATFEVFLGLAPQFDRPGAVARFRAWTGDEGAREIWLDEEVHGDRRREWQRVVEEVEVPAGGRLVLEVEASRHGRPLPEGAAMWGAPVLASADGRTDEPAAPHLIVLAIDTLRADVVGAYGSTDGLTPHLDRLAARSVRFDDLHAPSSWTLPSMASLLTGLPPQSHDTGRTLGDDDFAPTALGPETPALAEVLAEAGFFTVGVYNNIFLGPSFGVSRGFDLYHWIEEEDDVLVDRAIELLRRYRNDRRLFLLLHLFGPHNPYAPPEDACEVARRLEPEGPKGSRPCAVDRRPGEPVPPAEERPWIEALYRGEVAYTDRQVGRFLDALDEMGLTEQAVLLVVSDHGEDFWGRLAAYDAYGGYEDADHGHTHYRELLWVPGLLRAPGVEPAVVTDPVELVDFFPTVLTLLGVEPPAREPSAREGSGDVEGDEQGTWVGLRDVLPGEDLTPVLRGEGERPERRTLLSDFLLYGARRWSVRRGPWKLIVPHGEPEEGLAPELYNLDEDPEERVDLFARRPEIAASLRQAGERELARREALRRRLRAGQDALNAAHLQWNHITKLRALGYLK